MSRDIFDKQEERIARLQQIIRMALAYTPPSRDQAMWRVAAIEELPEAEREHFYNMLSRSVPV